MGNSMQHWNGNHLCVIDTETTGLDVDWHEIIQICILPLDSNFTPRTDIIPFYINMIPDNPERASKEAMQKNKLKLPELIKTGFDKIKVIDMLEDWIQSLGMPVTAYGRPKCVMPLGHNYAFDRSFIMQWLGRELYDQWFYYHFRDTMIYANCLNDKSAMHAEKVPFSKTGLQYLCSTLKIQTERAHDALSDCIATAKVYKHLVSGGLIS